MVNILLMIFLLLIIIYLFCINPYKNKENYVNYSKYIPYFYNSIPLNYWYNSVTPFAWNNPTKIQYDDLLYPAIHDYYDRYLYAYY